MKYLITALIMVFSLSGCVVTDKAVGVVEDLTPTQAVIATLAIKAGTIDLIVKDVAKSAETAKTIVSVTTDAMSYISDGNTVIISELDDKLTERIAKLKLSPQKQLVVDMLISLVKARIELELTGNVLDAETAVIISKVLLIIKTTAEPYE